MVCVCVGVCFPQVLESLKSMAAAKVEPVPPCSQLLVRLILCLYLCFLLMWEASTCPRWLQADEEDPDDAVGDEKPKGSSAKKKAAQKAVKQKKDKCGKPKASENVATKKASKPSKKGENEPACSSSAYVPGQYQEKRLKWITKRRKKFQMTFREASTAWNTCLTREKLLENMPHAEKVRRRFI